MSLRVGVSSPFCFFSVESMRISNCVRWVDCSVVVTDRYCCSFVEIWLAASSRCNRSVMWCMVVSINVFRSLVNDC